MQLQKINVVYQAKTNANQPKLRKVNFCGFELKLIKINNNLYGGPKPKYKDLKALKKDGVNLIIDLRHHYFPQVIIEKAKCYFLGLNHFWQPITIKNEFVQKNVFENIANLANKNKDGTYVHCRSGKHRTNFALSAIEILNNKKSVDSEINAMQEQRNYWNIRINKNIELKRQTMILNLKHFKEMFSNENNLIV